MDLRLVLLVDLIGESNEDESIFEMEGLEGERDTMRCFICRLERVLERPDSTAAAFEITCWIWLFTS